MFCWDFNWRTLFEAMHRLVVNGAWEANCGWKFHRQQNISRKVGVLRMRIELIWPGLIRVVFNECIICLGLCLWNSRTRMTFLSYSILCAIRIQLKEDGETGQTSFNLDLYGCQLAQTKIQLLYGCRTGLVACMRKVAIVSQQSRDFFPCEILFRLILVLPDRWVCNFQALLLLQNSCPSACVSCSHVKALFICEGIVCIAFTWSR